eukprot:GILK01004006.1.p1 GENE.GILK01004006.1~~GILK01004006.1.p1  ORF type:complete len:479 (-),score=92.08 GILK01004006.1:170-1498(-)
MAKAMEKPSETMLKRKEHAKKVLGKTGSRLEHYRRTSEFVAPMKFRNVLPPIPSDPKLLTYPFDPMRFVRYQTSSLEAAWKPILLSEHDLGVHVDLIDPQTYQIPIPVPALDPEDQSLISDDIPLNQDKKKGRFSMSGLQHSWLRKHQLMMNDVYDHTHKFTKLAGEEEAAPKAEDEELDVPKQISLIKDTFAAMQKPPVHPSKPHLTPLSILPILPDKTLWSNMYSHILFDDTPSECVMQVNGKTQTNPAILRYAKLENDNVLSYFVAKKRKRGDNEETETATKSETEAQYTEYEWLRDYVYEIRVRESQDNFFFVIGDDAVTYSELRSKVILQKHKAKGKVVENTQRGRNNPSVIELAPRDLDETERKQKRSRLHELRGVMRAFDQDDEDDEGLEGENSQSRKDSQAQSQDSQTGSQKSSSSGNRKSNSRIVSDDEDESD